MIKENGEWKILGFNIEVPRKQEVVEKREEHVEVPLIYQDPKGNYSIHYRKDWNSNTSNQDTVTFTPKASNKNKHLKVKIQLISLKSSPYKTIQDYVASLKKKISSQYKQGKIVSHQEADMPQEKQIYPGEYLIYVYMKHDKPFKQLRMVINKDGQLLVWSYSAPYKEFNDNLPTAQAMYESIKLN